MNDLAPRAKILLFGASGQLGNELHQSLAAVGNLVSFKSPKIMVPQRELIPLDLCDDRKLKEVLKQHKPDLIVNAAAYTQVDHAEKERDKAFKINAEVPDLLARFCHDNNIPMVHFSTDYVYGSNSDTPLCEDDAVTPTNVYGASKLEGEQAITASGCDHLILRISWVYGAQGHNFVKRMIELMHEKEKLSIVSDQIGSPCSAKAIACNLNTILYKKLNCTNFKFGKDAGIYNYSPQPYTSWHGLSLEIKSLASDFGCNLTIQEIASITSDDFKTPASRPKNSRLDSSMIQKVFGINIPTWHHSLSAEFPVILKSVQPN